MTQLTKAQISNLPLSHYVSLLRDNKPFSFSRWGDGEWQCIMGKTFTNADGSLFDNKLREDLLHVLENNKPYYHGMLNIVFDRLDYVPATEIKWYDGDVMLRACLEGELWPMIEQIRKRTVMYIGNHRLTRLTDNFFDIKIYREIPAINAHRERVVLRRAIHRAIRRKGIDFVGYSAGPVSKLLIDDLHGENVTQIDFGSTFDGFFRPMPNVHPLGGRKFIRSGNHNWGKLLEANTRR